MNPRTWTFVEYGENQDPWKQRSWARRVRRGEKASLGPNFDAEVVPMQLDDGTSVFAKWIVYLGD